MKRFFGMIVLFVALFIGLWALAAGFYLAAGWLAYGFALLGLPPSYGAALANLVTLMLVVLMVSSSLLTVAERKWSAMLQNRVGANRIKVFGYALGGIPFLVADALKMLTKERIEPVQSTRFLFELAPVLAFAPVFALFAIVPVGAPLPLQVIVDRAGLLPPAAASAGIPLQVAVLDAGLLYVFAIASLQVYGTSLAGWASNNKLALLGGVRASSQMISYEVSLGLSLVGCMIAYRTLRLDQMVVAQGAGVIGGVFQAWGGLLQPFGFLIFFASAFAETKRAPFDLPEGESEIVGYFVEYSGMKFGLMFLAEFAEIAVLSGVVTAVFLGGWHLLPSPHAEAWLREHLRPLPFAALGAAAFIVKMVVLMWLQLVIRWLLPRFRFDQIQKLCWKILLPAALTNVFVTAAAVLFDPTLELLAWLGVVTIVAIGVLTAAVSRGPAPAAEHGAAHAAGH